MSTETPRTEAAKILIYSGAKTDIQRLLEWENDHAKLERELTDSKAEIERLRAELAEAKLPSVAHVQLVYEVDRLKKELAEARKDGLVTHTKQ
jgi:uncharacterized coiled-coil DUF342 family protein